MVRVADYVIDGLVKKGIKHIFLITGRGILYLTDAVAKNPEMEGVSMYHEQGASYAAMAYAAARDGMAACLVSTGCAATNAVTACLCAYQDNLPVIFISGQNMLNETTRYTHVPIRTYGSQEADIISVVEPISKYSVMITEADKIGIEMDKLFYFANEGRKGPVWIDIPLDIQNARVEETALERFEYEISKLDINEDVIREVVNDINASERPLFFIGGGLRSAEAIEEYKLLIEKTNIPTVFSAASADAFGSENEMSLGAVGSLGGSRVGNFAVQNADLVIAIGTKLTGQSVGNFKEFAREAKVIVVDIDPNEHMKKGVKINVLINSNAKDFINRLLAEEIKLCNPEWVSICSKWKSLFDIDNEVFVKKHIAEKDIDLYHFADVVSNYIKDDTCIITDAGFEELIIPATIRFGKGKRCLFPAAQGAMGYAIPAIIGAYYAGKRNIVCIVGDGSFMMNVQELLLIGSRKIPVKIFVINNNMYSVIRKRQKDLFRNRTIGNDPSDGLAAPNIKKITEAFEIDYCEIADELDFRNSVHDILNADKPIICEVHCVEEQEYLHTSFAFNEKRKMVKKPLEDLSPFLDRELFYSEMIVKPIDE